MTKKGAIGISAVFDLLLSKNRNENNKNNIAGSVFLNLLFMNKKTTEITKIDRHRFKKRRSIENILGFTDNEP